MKSHLYLIYFLLLSPFHNYAQQTKPTIVWKTPVNGETQTTNRELDVNACIKSGSRLTSFKFFINGQLHREKVIGIAEDPVSVTVKNCIENVKLRVKLKKGKNTIKLVASNIYGTDSSLRKIFLSEPEVRKFAENLKEKRRALIIGNGDYIGDAYDILGCRQDADSMAAALHYLGFEVFVKKDLNKYQFKETIDSFCSSLNGYDAALLYYSGHGSELNGVTYLYPTDAANMDAKELISNFSLGTSSTLGLSGRIRASGVKNTLIFIDACRSMPKVQDAITLQQLQFNLEEMDLSALEMRNNGLFIAYATRTGESAIASKGNSVYTKALLKQIRKRGIPITETMAKVQSNLNLSASQTSSYYYDLPNGFYFIPPDYAIDSSIANTLINIHEGRGYTGLIRSHYIDTLASRDSISGLQFHLDFNVAYMAGTRGLITIEFYDTAFIPLRDFDHFVEPVFRDGDIFLQTEFASSTYIYQNEDFTNKLFLAYSKFDPKLKNKTIFYRITIASGGYNRLMTRLISFVMPSW